MNLYTITNLRNGLVFQTKAEVQPDYQKEWGTLAGTKPIPDIDEWEKINGSAVDAKTWQFPDSFTIDVLNIDIDVAQEEQAKIDFVKRIDRLKLTDYGLLPPETQEVFRDIIIEVIRLSGQ